MSVAVDENKVPVFVISVPSDNVDEFVELFAEAMGYKPQIDDGTGGKVDNPTSAKKFGAIKVSAWVEAQVMRQKRRAIQEATKVNVSSYGAVGEGVD